MTDTRGAIALAVLLPLILLGSASAMIWVERRLLALVQDRYGPNRVGPFGLLQTVADALKLFFKQDWIPPFANKTLFVAAPAIIMITTMLSFAVVAFAPAIVVADLNVGLLYFLAFSSLGVYSVVLGGWASNSKLPLLGAIRAAGQMFSYEIFMGLSAMGVVMIAGSFDLTRIVDAQQKGWFVVPQFLGFFAFVIAGFAETRRSPLDLPEAENELVAGYHTEYSAIKFGLFLMGEYTGVALVSSFITLLFFGGWHGIVLPDGIGWFLAKTALFMALFIMARWSVPRPRYDQLMRFGWRIMLPLVLLNLVLTAAVILARQR